MNKALPEDKRTLKKRIRSFAFALHGLTYLFRTQPNAVIHFISMILVIVMGIFFNLNSIEWILVIFAIGLVISAEAFNTALEELVDLVSPEYHEKAGRVKDLAAGGVLVAAISAAIIGGIIFIPKILACF